MSYRNTWSITGATSITSLKDCYKWNNENRLRSFGMLRLNDNATDAQKQGHNTVMDTSDIPIQVNSDSTEDAKKYGGCLNYYGLPGFLIDNKMLFGIGYNQKDNIVEKKYTHSSLKYPSGQQTTTNTSMKNWNYLKYPTIIPFLNQFVNPDAPSVSRFLLRAKDKTFYTHMFGTDTSWCAQIPYSEENANTDDFLVAYYRYTTLEDLSQYNCKYKGPTDVSFYNSSFDEKNTIELVIYPEKNFYQNGYSAEELEVLWKALFYEVPQNTSHSLIRSTSDNVYGSFNSDTKVTLRCNTFLPYYYNSSNYSFANFWNTSNTLSHSSNMYSTSFNEDLDIDFRKIPIDSSIVNQIQVNFENRVTARQGDEEESALSKWYNWTMVSSEFNEWYGNAGLINFLNLYYKRGSSNYSYDIRWNNTHNLKYPYIQTSLTNYTCPIILSSEPAFSFERVLDTRQSNTSYAYRVYKGCQIATVANTGGSITFDIYEGNTKLQTTTITLSSDSDSSGGVPIKKNGVTVAYVAWDGVDHSTGVPGSLVSWTQEEQEQGSFGHWLGFNANGFSLMPIE